MSAIDVEVVTAKPTYYPGELVEVLIAVTNEGTLDFGAALRLAGLTFPEFGSEMVRLRGSGNLMFKCAHCLACGRNRSLDGFGNCGIQLVILRELNPDISFLLQPGRQHYPVLTCVGLCHQPLVKLFEYAGRVSPPNR